MTEYVLIDNDELIRMSWELAAKKSNTQLSTFKNTQEFFDQSATFSFSTHVYIDYELDDGKNGVDEALAISELGFSNIFLATGYKGDDIQLPSYILEIVGKRSPF